jgi:1,4-dihydroxy-6-naphthoate synthase
MGNTKANPATKLSARDVVEEDDTTLPLPQLMRARRESADKTDEIDIAQLRPVSLAYSVDADDAFMFHAVAQGLVPLGTLSFTHRRADTAALNEIARNEEADVVAVSLGAYPALARTYQILPHGASVGRGYGPVVVAREPLTAADLAGKRIGIPGVTTTAWLVFRLIQAGAVPVTIPIAPFNRVFEALSRHEVDAALLIHEGRLLYEARGFHKVVDLGEWWWAETALPLPLGVNVIRRGLGEVTVAQVSSVLRASIRWALSERAAMVDRLAQEDRGEPALADPALIDHYLSLYANDDTATLAPDVKAAVEALFARARAAGLVESDVQVDWAP